MVYKVMQSFALTLGIVVVSLGLIHAAPPVTTDISKLESTYGFEVVVTSKPDPSPNGFLNHVKPAKPEEVEKYERLFVKEWSLYPASFVRRANVKKVTIAAGISVGEQFRAAVPDWTNNTMLYDPVLGAYNEHYQRSVVHHEFFHFVDARMDLLYSDPLWRSLNPKDFKYGTGGQNMQTHGAGELTDKIPGFLTPYGTSGVEEDKAELFAHMIVDGEYVRKRAAVDQVLASKITLLREELQIYDLNMGTEFWKKIPGWQDTSTEKPFGG